MLMWDCILDGHSLALVGESSACRTLSLSGYAHMYNHGNIYCSLADRCFVEFLRRHYTLYTLNLVRDDTLYNLIGHKQGRPGGEVRNSTPGASGKLEQFRRHSRALQSFRYS